MSFFEAKQGKRAAAWCHPDFILVETYSGRGRTMFDPLGAQLFLPADASDAALGAAVADALARSRLLSSDESAAYFQLKRVAEQYAKWVDLLLSRGPYKSRRELFKPLKNCGIHHVGDTVTFRPTVHERLEAWGREQGDGLEDVTIPGDSDPEKLGAALRLAFDRCA
jgi:hypothetical protein